MKTTFSKMAATSLASLAVIGSAGWLEPANAAILNKTNTLPSLSGISSTGFDCALGSVEGATQCVGAFSGNDVTNGGANNPASRILATGVFNNITNWTFGVKIDDDGPNVLNTIGFSINQLGENQGTFAIDNLDAALTNLAISLKGSNEYSIYYIAAGSLQSFSSINWNTLGVAQNNPELSHASVYYNVIPTPALLPGLVGMGIAAWRKRKGEVADSTEA